jgi:hypothetical protein
MVNHKEIPIYMEQTMSLKKKVSIYFLVICILLSLTGCVDFDPDVQPIEISQPNATPALKTLVPTGTIIPMPPPAPAQPDAFTNPDVKIDVAFGEACTFSQEQEETCMGDSNLGFRKLPDGNYRIFLDGKCYILDKNADQDVIVGVINSREEIKQIDDDFAGKAAAAGLGVGALIGTVMGVGAACAASAVAGPGGWLACAGVIIGIACALGLSVTEVVQIIQNNIRKEQLKSSIEEFVKGKQSCY